MFKVQMVGIGSGVFGTVYTVNNHKFPNAIKKTRESEEFNITEYMKEWDEIKDFDHKNMVSIFGIEKLDTSSLLITMEEMDYNLTKFLEAHPHLALDKSLSILCDVSSAIDYLHSLPTPRFHGNLHSRNILLTSSLLAKISDVMPQELVQKCIDGGMLRTYAPKRIPSDCSNEWLDIFAFGLIACHVYTKQPPVAQNDGSGDHEPNEVDRYRKYLDLIKDEACKKLVIECVASTPSSSFIYDSMKRLKKDFSDGRIVSPVHPTTVSEVDDVERKGFKTSNETTNTTRNYAARNGTAMVSGGFSNSVISDDSTDTLPNIPFSEIDSRTESTLSKEMETMRLDNLQSETATDITTSPAATSTSLAIKNAQSDMLNKKPEMFDLSNIVIPKIMNKWEYIAEALRYDVPVIQSIKDKGQGDSKKCCREFFQDWLTTNNGAKAGQKVWSTLIYALKRVNEISVDITEDIIAELKSL